MDKLSQPIFFRLTKIDEEQRLVSGIATAEKEDKSGEVCHYESTKPFYEKWSEGFKKATDGKSLGNVRAMHQPEVAGKVVELNFHDEAKEIEITAKIVDDHWWNMVKEGCITGFSQGGEYVKKWKEDDLTYYTANPSEVSIVDNPCLGEATFAVVKANGETEMRKFHTKQEPLKTEEPVKKAEPEVVQGWQAKDGTFHKTKAEAIKHNQTVEADEIAKAATAGVAKLIGDIKDRLDDVYWKRDFSDEERKKMAESGEAMSDGSFPIKSEQDLKNAIRAVGRAKDPAKAKAHIKTRAKALGLESLIPDDWKIRKKTGLKVTKDLCTVADAAVLIQQLEWICDRIHCEEAWEEDEHSVAPEHLEEIIHELCEFLTTYAEEECAEMVEDHGGTGIEDALEAMSGNSLKALERFAKGKLADAIKKADEGFQTHEHAPHPDRVHAVHKAAGRVMEHCMKATHEMHCEEGDAAKMAKGLHEAADHLHKAHKAGQEIMQHCMKMGSKLEEGEGDGEHAQKLLKAQAVNSALEKTIEDLTGQLGGLLKRIDHLERQPGVRKGALFDVNDRSHEAPPGNAPVETDPFETYDALRLSPEDERRISKRR